jgi:hypothetical protein
MLLVEALRNPDSLPGARMQADGALPRVKSRPNSGEYPRAPIAERDMVPTRKRGIEFDSTPAHRHRGMGLVDHGMPASNSAAALCVVAFDWWKL